MTARYPAIVRRLHWLTVALFAWPYVSRALSSTVAPESELAFHLSGLHTIGGLLILTFAITRIGARLRYTLPPLPATLGDLKRRAALAMHVLLYALMLAQPLLGFLAVRSPEAALAHALMAWAGLTLIGLHVAAALSHRFIARDTVFERVRW